MRVGFLYPLIYLPFSARMRIVAPKVTDMNSKIQKAETF